MYLRCETPTYDFQQGSIFVNVFWYARGIQKNATLTILIKFHIFWANIDFVLRFFLHVRHQQTTQTLIYVLSYKTLIKHNFVLCIFWAKGLKKVIYNAVKLSLNSRCMHIRSSHIAENVTLTNIHNISSINTFWANIYVY